MIRMLERKTGLHIEGEPRLLGVNFKHFLLGTLLRVRLFLTANFIALRKL